MKHWIKFLSGLALSGLLIFTAYAATTSEPSLDSVNSPVDANKAIISGATEPEAKIIITGGPYELPPYYADENGYFSVSVSLVQNSTNIFQVQAQASGEDPSDAVTVTIVENADQAASAEANGGGDYTAPDAPELEFESMSTTEDSLEIEGTAEAGTTVHARLYNTNSSYTDLAASDGSFSIEVDLTGSSTKDLFEVYAIDDAGNVSSSSLIYITSSADDSSNNEDEEDDSSDQEDEDEDQDEETELSDILDHWAKDYITELVDMGAVNGYSDNTFRPDQAITRAELLKIAMLTYDTNYSEWDGSFPFTDLNSEDWFIGYVSHAHSLGVVGGYSDGSFQANNNITRAEALKILVEAAGNINVNAVSPNFDDVDLSNDWFAMYTSWAMTNNIVSGYDDGGFHPNQDITRAEATKIIKEILDYSLAQ